MLDGTKPAPALAGYAGPMVHDQPADDLAFVPAADVELAAPVKSIPRVGHHLVGEPDQVVHGPPVISRE